MKTPNELKQTEEKEAQIRRETAKRIEQDISGLVDYAYKNGELTSDGGRIRCDLMRYSARHGDEVTVKFVIDYLKRNGWKAEYHQEQDSSWSITAKSEVDFTVDVFELSPVKTRPKYFSSKK